jgi:uncharacterized protein YjbJ (UPF0337 family)
VAISDTLLSNFEQIIVSLNVNLLGAMPPILVVMNRQNNEQERTMDNDRIQGAGKQVKGTVKQAIGKVTGNKQTEVDGAAEKVVGKVQGKIGKAKDTVRDTFRK